MQEPYVLAEHNNGVSQLTLNRPKSFNALSEEMLAAVHHELDYLPNDCRVVVLRASGRAFCAGHDLKQMRQHTDQAYFEQLFARCSALMSSIVQLPVPVIAEVQGLATAAGCQLVATCDLAIAADTAEFAVSGINVGLFCSTPSVALSRNLNRKRAMQLLMTGEFIDAPTAVEWGLINESAPADELSERVKVMTEKIISKSAVAVKTGKQLFYKQLEMGLSDAYELAGRTMACNMMADDVAEGIDAFIEKRNPEWTHS